MHSSGKQQIERGGVAGLFLSLFGYRYRSIALSDAGLSLAARSFKDVAFSEIPSTALVTKIMGFTAVAVPLRHGGNVTVAGVRRADADDFVSSINAAWRHHFAEQVEKVDTELRALAEVVGRLSQPRRYPSACLLEPFLIRAS
jgi:DNA helicase-4